MSDEQGYKLRVESRLSRLETQMNDIITIAASNTKSINSMEKTIARLTLITPALSAAVFVIGLLLGHQVAI